VPTPNLKEEHMTNLSIIYYSSTGHGTRMAQVLSDAAEEAGATVRLRHIAENARSRDVYVKPRLDSQLRSNEKSSTG
jgi:hypothetical protein